MGKRRFDHRPFGLSDRVVRRSDPRHVGEVVAFDYERVTVRWLETGWRETLSFSALARDPHDLLPYQLVWAYRAELRRGQPLDAFAEYLIVLIDATEIAA